MKMKNCAGMKWKGNKTVKANKANSSSGLNSLVYGGFVVSLKHVSERISLRSLHKLIRVAVFVSRVLEVLSC